MKNINCSGPIDKVLNEVFANTGITYLIQGNDVVLKVSKTESAQQAKKTEIVGVVTDARTGEAVIGASVAIVGTTTGVITDIDGKFVIQAGPQDVLKISYVGYTAKEVKVGNRKVLAIDMRKQLPAYKIVGSQEADVMSRAISEDSPFGKALMGRKAGDEVTVEAPKGVIHYRVDKIER